MKWSPPEEHHEVREQFFEADGTGTYLKGHIQGMQGSQQCHQVSLREGLVRGTHQQRSFHTNLQSSEEMVMESTIKSTEKKVLNFNFP